MYKTKLSSHVSAQRDDSTYPARPEVAVANVVGALITRRRR